MLPESFNDALRQYAASTPAKTFCHFSKTRQSLSYAELESRVEQRKQALGARGVGPGCRIAIHLPLSPQLVIDLLAVMSVGAVAVPVPHSLHQAAFESMMRILDPHLVIGPATSSAHPEFRGEPPALSLSGQPEAAAGKLPAEASLGIFTSGSTSQPKCVLLSPANLLAGATFVIQAHAINGSDIATCCMPLSHINGVVTTVLAPLLSGSSVAFMQEKFSPRSFAECMQRYRATWFSAAPAHYQLLLYPGKKAPRLNACRFGRSASAPLRPEIQQRFEQLYGIPVIQTMGLTECSGQVFSNPMPPGESKAGSVGRPVGNEAEIVGPDDRPLDPGETGEIRVRGPNVMLGYLGDAKATAETVRDGWLYTGDLAHRDEEGCFFVTGRKKLIAIIGGENVSLVAVEDAARRVPSVDDAAALIRESDVTGEVIDLFYTGDAGENRKTIQAIRSGLLGLLPTHHALGTIKRVDALPRNQSGKLLRSELRRL